MGDENAVQAQAGGEVVGDLRAGLHADVGCEDVDAGVEIEAGGYARGGEGAVQCVEDEGCGRGVGGVGEGGGGGGDYGDAGDGGCAQQEKEIEWPPHC